MKSKVNPTKKTGRLGSRYTSYVMYSFLYFLYTWSLEPLLDPRLFGDHPHVAKREAVWPSPSPGVVTPVAVANEGLTSRGSLTKNEIFLVVCHPGCGGRSKVYITLILMYIYIYTHEYNIYIYTYCFISNQDVLGNLKVTPQLPILKRYEEI